MRDDQGRTSPRATKELVQLQLRRAHERAGEIARELDDLGSRLRHLDRISSSVEQADGMGPLKQILFRHPTTGRKAGLQGGSGQGQSR